MRLENCSIWGKTYGIALPLSNYNVGNHTF